MKKDAITRSLLERASRLLQTGPVVEAIAVHERLLARCPGLPDSWYNLGYLLQAARRFEAAAQAYQRALDHGVNRPEEVRLNRAAVLADHLARPDEARRDLEAAVAANGRFLPARLNLGNLHEQEGERDLARRAYEAALALEPGQPLALARLAGLKELDGRADPLIGRLREALARPEATAVERADLGFGLGKALDSVGAWDEAFAVYVAANRASRESAAPAAPYDARGHERFVDRLIATFAERVEPVPSASQDEPPIFICGMFRSGSTLVEQILASHPRVRGGGEIDLLPALAGELLVAQDGRFGPIDEATAERARRGYLDALRRLFPGAERITDKRPDNFLLIGLIKRLFPRARIVHTHREPIDNCLSVFFLHLSHAMPYALDLGDTAHWYGQYRRLMAHWKSLYGDDICDIDYDRLVVDPRSVVGPLLEHCGLSWDDACLAFHRTRTHVRTPSAWQVRQPMYTRSSGRWRHYERHLDGLREALEKQRAP